MSQLRAPGFYCVDVHVLGIDVEPSLVRRWAGWLAPACQPFFLTAGEVVDLGLTPDPTRELSYELGDTYQVWNLPDGLDVVWLDEHAFHALSREVRAELVRAQVRHHRGAVPSIGDWADVLDERLLREQADGQHFVWWPTLVRGQRRTEAVLERVVTDDQLPCRRTSVPDDVWRAAAAIVPDARALAGTFAYGRASCFGTVMAAAGVEGAVESWLVPFEAWLAANCVAGGRDDVPGTVLVWRDADLASTHTAVTLGRGWALHKPGQDWICPRQVVTVHDLVRTAPPGVTLHRYALQDPAT